LTTTQRGIAFFVLSQAFLAIEAALIHHYGMSGLTVGQIILFRSAGCFFLLVFLARHSRFSVLKTSQLQAHVIRGLLTFVSMALIFYSLSNMALADAVALSYTRSIWLTVLGMLLLHEVVPAERWLASLFGLLGAIFVINPVFGDWNFVYFIALCGAFLNAAAIVSSRDLSRLDPPVTVMSYVTLIGLIIGLPFAFEPLPPNHWPAVLLIATAGAGSMWFGLLAIRDTDVSILAPYDYIRLPLLMIISIFVFAEIPTSMTAIGSFLIFLSGTIVFFRQQRN